MWNWLGDSEKQIKLIFTVLAAIYIYFEYNDKRQQDRIGNSMDYIRRYTDEKGSIYPAREHLFNFWIDRKNVNVIKKLKIKSSPKIYDETIPKMLKSLNLHLDVYKILIFYRDINICVQANRCDQKVICSYFFKEIQDFRENYRAILSEWTQTIGESAPVELEQLMLQETCSIKFKEYCSKNQNSPYCSGGLGSNRTENRVKLRR